MRNSQFKIIVSGPPASCKSTFINKLTNKNWRFNKIIQTTDREKREGEVHGKDYYFIYDISKINRDSILESRTFESTGKTYLTTYKSFICGDIIDVHCSQIEKITSSCMKHISIYMYSPEYILKGRYIYRSAEFYKKEDAINKMYEFDKRYELESECLANLDDFDISYNFDNMFLQETNYDDLIYLINKVANNKYGITLNLK